MTMTTTQAGSQIRAALKAAFPGTKFSVRGARGTGYGWFSVIWTDGPTEDAVRSVTNPIHASLHNIGGINHTRHYSDDAEAWANVEVFTHPERYSSLADEGASPEYIRYITHRRALARTDFREEVNE